MTKLLSITTSLLILIQSFGIHADDLVVLDELLEHAEFHAEEYGDNFFVFISKHYGELKVEHSQKHQEEREDHERLPFQHHCHSTNLLSALVLDQVDTPALTIHPIAERDSNFFYLVSYHSLALGELFQPPRHA
ncbi:hypothetical protein [Pareuzebyella sediminis]|uniref:hypothetical protein n=1 Tax=Pareuzebyella sediminis TaxID=2607998 RepID=UPI0011ED2F39|nr:hypothetical protein [Pareuzebyella sediminis]